MSRACSVHLLAAVLLIAWSPSVGEGQYLSRQVTTTQGGVTFVGNALGLNKNGTQDEPGTTEDWRHFQAPSPVCPGGNRGTPLRTNDSIAAVRGIERRFQRTRKGFADIM